MRFNEKGFWLSDERENPIQCEMNEQQVQKSICMYRIDKEDETNQNETVSELC